MTETLSPASPRRWVYAPLALVLVLAAAWTAGWFYAAQRAYDVVSAWLDREARLGREIGKWFLWAAALLLLLEMFLAARQTGPGPAAAAAGSTP